MSVEPQKTGRQVLIAGVIVLPVLLLVVGSVGALVLWFIFTSPPAEPERVNRASFSVMYDKMSRSDAEQLLGPGRTDAVIGRMVNVSWRSRDGRHTILATFDDDRLVSRSILGP